MAMLRIDRSEVSSENAVSRLTRTLRCFVFSGMNFCSGGRFVMGHPEKLIDFAYRAEHEMTLEAKRLITALYGQVPVHSY